MHAILSFFLFTCTPVWTRRPSSPDYLKWYETSSFEYLALLRETVQKTRAKEANRPWQPNSLVIRRAKLNNGLPFKHVYHVPACDFDETWGAMLGERSLWPPYLGPSVSIRHHKAPPSPPRPLSIRLPASTRVLHYCVLLDQRSETSAEDAGRRNRVRLHEENKNRMRVLFSRIPPFLCFLEVITGLPKLNWGK